MNAFLTLFREGEELKSGIQNNFFWKVTKHSCMFSILSRFLSYLSSSEILLSFLSKLDFQVQKIENKRKAAVIADFLVDSFGVFKALSV